MLTPQNTDTGATPPAANPNPAPGATPEIVNPDEGATPEIEPQPKADEKPKTLAELQAENDSLKNQISTVNRESADRRKKLTALEAAQQKQADAELSDAQREKKRADDAETKLAAKDENLRRYSVLDATRAAAQKQSLVLNEAALQDAYAAGAFKSIELDDDGLPQGADAHLKELVKSRPYILQNQVNAPDHNAGKGGKSDELISDEEHAANARRFGLRVPTRR